MGQIGGTINTPKTIVNDVERELHAGNPDQPLFESLAFMSVKIADLRLTHVQEFSVTLGANGFDVQVHDADSLVAGIAFLHVNSPASLHELLVIYTDAQVILGDLVTANAWYHMTAAQFIAAAEIGQPLDESGMDIRFDSGDLHAGESASGYVYLHSGKYVFLCNEAGHVHAGMAVDVLIA